MRLKFGYTPWTKKKIEMVQREWPERTRRFMAEFTRQAAEYAHEEIVSRIPKTEEFSTYRDSLKVVRVRGSKNPAFAIYGSVKANRRVKPIDAPKTVFYVRAHKKLKGIPKDIQVLEKFSPWTTDTLPFVPSKKVATLVSRTVHPKEVGRVSKKRRNDRPKWRRALAAAGVREIRKDTGGQRLLKRGKAIPDVAFQALRLEFGLGTSVPRAHWRPGIRSLKAVGISELARRKPFVFAFTKVGFREWTKWPSRGSISIREAEAQDLTPFQKKLGIRI